MADFSTTPALPHLLRRLTVPAVALLLTSCCLQARPPAIPKMADLAGLRVGYDTRQSLDRRLGPAHVSIGGHPRGVHEWRSRQTGWGLHTDAFYDNGSGGTVIDSLSVFVPQRDLAAVLPRANLPARQMRFMGLVSPGMDEAEVLRLLKGKLPPPQTAGDSLIWVAKGEHRFNSLNHYVFKTWTAKLRFEHGRLSEIEVDAS